MPGGLEVHELTQRQLCDQIEQERIDDEPDEIRPNGFENVTNPYTHLVSVDPKRR